MSIIPKLASSLNRRDEVPNQELARQIIKANDKKAVKELFDNVIANKDRGIQNDCIKVIYEVGGQKPQLISEFVKELLALLNNKNNRLQWGAMMALHTITSEEPKALYKALPLIIDAADKGSVITNDHCIGVLIELAAIKEYATAAFDLLNERLRSSATNQLPMYAERALPIINEKNKAAFITTLTARLGDIERVTGRVRVEKLIRKLMK
ncbi:MAG TPA: hypothetical protein VHL77_02290 [Ferruginibacter sp.]|jgi:hypothetical protein|nr:hypothetical protein [Ferruginibacter sp.]